MYDPVDYPARPSEPTLAGTVAKRCGDFLQSDDGTPLYGSIDIDDAEWQKQYDKAMEERLNHLKDIGFYRKLQEMHILRQEGDFEVIDGDDDEVEVFPERFIASPRGGISVDELGQ